MPTIVEMPRLSDTMEEGTLAGWLKEVTENEWKRVRRPFENRKEFWRDYLLGAFDVLYLAPDFRDFVHRQAQLADPAGKRPIEQPLKNRRAKRHVDGKADMTETPRHALE